jgi:hypothetical protein
MDLISTYNYFKDGIDFNFNTTYMNDEITLQVVSNTDRYSILHNEKTIGHIKVGKIRHTWYVVDSNFTAPYLVDEIGNRIAARF